MRGHAPRHVLGFGFASSSSSSFLEYLGAGFDLSSGDGVSVG
jgi:hypothetical protein